MSRIESDSGLWNEGRADNPETIIEATLPLASSSLNQENNFVVNSFITPSPACSMEVIHSLAAFHFIKPISVFLSLSDGRAVIFYEMLKSYVNHRHEEEKMMAG